MTNQLEMALFGEDMAETVRALLERGLWGRAPVAGEVVVDLEDVEPTADWFDRYVRTGKQMSVYFGADRNHYIRVHPREQTVRASFDMEADGDTVVSLLSGIPFHVASFSSLHPEWEAEDSAYPTAPGFGRYHLRHGWACAFQGKGHAWLVSRRWLDHGPWQLFHGPNDTTLVQFHAPGLDAGAAFEQAAPAHRRMGVEDEGGYLQKEYVYKHGVQGTYVADRRVIEIVAIGREVPALELRDAAAAWQSQALGPDKPLDNVAFVFLDPAEAREQLPRLWLYGLECWTVIDEVKTRLDTEEPPPGVDEAAW
ncbi:hypothetical protein OG909_32220 [Streptomyces sp. NBC_01754]|uniref:hypothetical protein n=1 Tax=Streptomyces sp. NBC_01754 TaxID=2975930 RepID=UPI002DDC4AA7|nr:hypothetical protein [Streptomyces sp. NBC_01754]WSC90899.1 hypothetical protein OG909_00485 [Streptomyces sp. NBC_01754]WSC96607.1 hypothetical protein OG909_32220 [Streptomyces sp. NBC_01754]